MMDVQEVVCINLGSLVLLPLQRQLLFAQKFVGMEDDIGTQLLITVVMMEIRCLEMDVVVLVKSKLGFNVSKEENKIETFVMKSVVQAQEITETILVMMATIMMEMDVPVTVY